MQGSNLRFVETLVDLANLGNLTVSRQENPDWIEMHLCLLKCIEMTEAYPVLKQEHGTRPSARIPASSSYLLVAFHRTGLAPPGSPLLGSYADYYSAYLQKPEASDPVYPVKMQ